MFLDDKLYNHTINRQIDEATDFADLINELYKICEDHFKPQLSANMTYSEGVVIIDRVFNGWDLFIKRLKKENWFLVDFLDDKSYKTAFMSNEKLVEIYNKGKS